MDATIVAVVGYSKIIRIINSNSNTAVTDGMSDVLEPLRHESDPTLDCVTLVEGPFGIESEVDAFIIGFYSDWGNASLSQSY